MLSYFVYILFLVNDSLKLYQERIRVLHPPRAQQRDERERTKWSGREVDGGNAGIKGRLKGWTEGRSTRWWEVMEWGKRWMDVSMESEREMNWRQKEWMSEGREKWFVPSFPVCLVWSFTPSLCWGNMSGHYKRTGSRYAFGHIRENKDIFNTKITPHKTTKLW